MIDQSLITPFQSAPMLGMGDLGQVSLSSDISTWGIGEWAAVVGISYVAISLFFDFKNAGEIGMTHDEIAAREIGAVVRVRREHDDEAEVVGGRRAQFAREDLDELG